MKRKKIALILLSIGLCFGVFGCKAEEKKEDTSVEESVQKNTGKNAETGNNANKEKEEKSKAQDYPIVINPSLVEEMYSIIESEDIFCIFDGEKYGYVTQEGVEITGFTYDKAYPFSEGLACVYENGKYGFIDTEGVESLSFIYDDAAPFSDGLAYFVSGDEYGFMKQDGTVAFYLECDSISSFQEGFAYFSMDGKYGYIDKTGQAIIEPQYSDADYFVNGLAFVSIDGYKGAIDTNGNVVIPIQYENLSREDIYIRASIGEEEEFFDLSGVKRSEEIYDKKVQEDSEKNAKESDYTIKTENDTFCVYDTQGNEIFSMECTWSKYGIYHDSVNYVLDDETIVILEDNVDADLSEVVLKNSITPRKKLYWDLIHKNGVQAIGTDGGVESISYIDSWYEGAYITTTKLYDIDNSGNPILYYYETPIEITGFPLSCSGLYSIEDEELYYLVYGEECGGSLGGDYVCLWKDDESGETFIGTDGSAGGFAGYSYYSHIYRYELGKKSDVLSYEWIWQVTGNYDQEDLYNNADLFYNDEGVAFSNDDILKAGYVNEYCVNDERVTIEQYKEASQKYRMITLY